MEKGLAEYYGNIDLDKRQVYMNPETGQMQTEYSKSFGFKTPEGLVEVVLPTIVNGKPVNDEAAVAHYNKTGQHLGKFNINEWQKANPDTDMKQFYKYVSDYANNIHNRQDKRYNK